MNQSSARCTGPSIPHSIPLSASLLLHSFYSRKPHSLALSFFHIGSPILLSISLSLSPSRPLASFHSRLWREWFTSAFYCSEGISHSLLPSTLPPYPFDLAMHVCEISGIRRSQRDIANKSLLTIPLCVSRNSLKKVLGDQFSRIHKYWNWSLVTSFPGEYFVPFWYSIARAVLDRLHETIWTKSHGNY